MNLPPVDPSTCVDDSLQVFFALMDEQREIARALTEANCTDAVVGFAWANSFSNIIGQLTPGDDGPMRFEVTSNSGAQRSLSDLSEDEAVSMGALSAACCNADWKGAWSVWNALKPESQMLVMWNLANIAATIARAQSPTEGR